MKRILISIAAIIGVGGLIGLLSYHPKATQVGAASSKSTKTARSTPSTSASASPSSSGDAAGASTSSPGATKYKDGTYTGETVDVGFGPVQVQAVVSGGKLAAVNFLQMPSDQKHSAEITAQAEPMLRDEALTAQSATIDTVTGATQDSDGFSKSLASALSQANS